MEDDPIVIYVYQYEDGTTQVRCTQTDDRGFVREALENAILAVEDGTPVKVA